MDESKQFINMCEKAREIQDLRKSYMDWVCADDGIPDMGYIDNRLWFFTGNDEEFSLVDAVDNGIIWLPRQDQLQEMVGGFQEQTNLLLDYLMCNIGDAIEPVWDFNYSSWEQLWIALVMWKNHNKTWDGPDWIKREKGAS